MVEKVKSDELFTDNQSKKDDLLKFALDKEKQAFVAIYTYWQACKDGQERDFAEQWYKAVRESKLTAKLIT